MPPVAFRRPSAKQTLQAAHIPAPVGGINTIAPGSDMPSGDCVYLYNMIGSEFGLRSRLGYLEWCTGLGDETRTVIPFTGSRKDGTSDALFAATPAGIYNCTTSTASPSQVVTFPSSSGDAGFGISTIAASPGGRFLMHCDEENGLYVYPETTATWTRGASGATVAWLGSTAYEAGDKVFNGANTYTCAGAGTSASSGGPTGTGSGISDGSASWNYTAPFVATAFGASLADQRNGFEGNPENFVFGTVFANRVWFVEKDTSRAWYSGINAIYGTYTSFDFGSKMQHGGPLVGLYSWSYDGGSGMDTLLVAISQAGDILIYQGTDPSQSTTFGLKGVWFGGGVPAGRRIATDYGGDVLVLTTIGVLPLSKLVIGNPVVDRTQYTTAKIGSLFNLLTQTYKGLQGWGLCIHPTDNALLLTVPQAQTAPTTQLAFSFASKGWSQYRDIPMLSCGVWNGTLYFGTPDGRVCLNSGYVDNVLLSDSSSFSPVSWSLLTAYQNLGNARNKRVQMIRPSVLSESPNPVVQATAKYGFDLDEPSPPSLSSSAGVAGSWDVALWDVDVWAGAYVPSQPMAGGLGMGRDVAIAVQGTAVARTTLVGMDVLFDQGGLL